MNESQATTACPTLRLAILITRCQVLPIGNVVFTINGVELKA